MEECVQGGEGKLTRPPARQTEFPGSLLASGSIKSFPSSRTSRCCRKESAAPGPPPKVSDTFSNKEGAFPNRSDSMQKPPVQGRYRGLSRQAQASSGEAIRKN